jgi:methyl-accepting chemotaxis protein
LAFFLAAYHAPALDATAGHAYNPANVRGEGNVTAFEWVIAVCVVLITILTVAFLAGAVSLWLSIRRTLSRLSQRAESVIKQAENAAKTASEAADYVAGRARAVADAAHHIASQAEQTAKDVAHEVQAASGVLRDAVSEPAVRFASLWAGLRRGWETWASHHRKGRPGPGTSSKG